MYHSENKKNRPYKLRPNTAYMAAARIRVARRDNGRGSGQQNVENARRR